MIFTFQRMFLAMDWDDEDHCIAGSFLSEFVFCVRLIWDGDGCAMRFVFNCQLIVNQNCKIG